LVNKYTSPKQQVHLTPGPSPERRGVEDQPTLPFSSQEKGLRDEVPESLFTIPQPNLN
jgi:hypothetical protein